MEIKDFSVGVDIEDVARFKKLNKKTGRIFFRKILTEKELRYCFSKNNPFPYVAGRFCAKEAVIKALGGLGEAGLAFTDMEILNNKENAPKIFFKSGKFKKYKVKITISHGKDKALAAAVAVKI